MKSIKAIFETTTICTSINGTKEEIENYYKNNTFNVGVFPEEKIEKAKEVVFLY